MNIAPLDPHPPIAPPGPTDVEHRLRAMIELQAELLADPDQSIALDFRCLGACPAQHQGVVLCAAQELTANAIRHGFYARMIGHIGIELAADPDETRLTIADDGWGMGERTPEGAGLGRIRLLLAPFGGRLCLTTRHGLTAGLTARLTLPRAA